MQIWFRVGMAAEISAEELKELKSGNEDVMKNIIQKAVLSGETYVPDDDVNSSIYKAYEDEICFEF